MQLSLDKLRTYTARVGPGALFGLMSGLISLSVAQEEPIQPTPPSPTIPAPADVAAAPPDALRTASGLAMKVLSSQGSGPNIQP